MGTRVLLPAIAVSLVVLAGAPMVVSAETTHTYPVTLTISVDRSAGQLSGEILTDAPSEFCDSSTVRIREVAPGHDRVVARLFPQAADWRMKSTPALRGTRVYAEVLAYHLPQRPVECLAARSRSVTAP
ncbi:MAG TPA: hypothetical protein VIM28_04800 [Solirubrobacterales bacterium]